MSAMADPAATTTDPLAGRMADAANTLTPRPDASAKIGGVEPVPHKSMSPFSEQRSTVPPLGIGDEAITSSQAAEPTGCEQQMQVVRMDTDAHRCFTSNQRRINS